MINMYEQEWEQELVKRKDKEMRKEEGQRHIHQWCRKKDAEKYQKRREILRQKNLKLREKYIKRKEAEEVYRNWLKHNLVKLKKEKRTMKRQKKVFERSLKEKEISQAIKRNIAQRKWTQVNNRIHKKPIRNKPFRVPNKNVREVPYPLEETEKAVLNFEDGSSHEEAENFEIEENQMFEDREAESEDSEYYTSNDQSFNSY